MAQSERTVPSRTSGLPLRGLRVEVLKGPDQGKEHRAVSDSLTIGTSPGNDVVLTDETVSRFHLELQRRGDAILIADHGSTNGTLHGKARIERGAIEAGAQLVLGHTVIKVDDGEPVTVDLLEGESLGGLLGRSAEMRAVMARAERVARSDASVLVLGETGTGKEVLARAIHETSARASGPFETVDCGAMIPTLIASELFGHERGAFTGAETRHIGAFERADGGTLFLDEVGELPSALQTSLLGALERRSFRRLGGQETISVDVRLLCATNRDLRAEVNSGQFRQDVYFRIAVVLLRIPPLRERSSDIPLLVEHFLKEAGKSGEISEVIPERALRTLIEHHWPGNVRELRNYVEAALALGEAPPLEESRPLAEADAAGEDEDAAPLEPTPGGRKKAIAELSYADARAAVLSEFEAGYARSAVARNGGNISKAAREVGMNRTYLIALLKRHGIR